MTANPTIQPFISYGLLPENLPPVISSTGLWQHFSAYKGAYILNQKCVGWLSPYDASKRGNQRRGFALSHPAFVYEQAAFLEKNWNDIVPLFSRSPGSQSIPSFPTSGPRATRITPHSELPAIRLRKLSRYKFCLVADVSRCFPSIYTHSIPWAVHGKEASKSDTKSQSATVFANRLDTAFRQAQDRQTMGLPIGPDTSRVTSEIVLSAVDDLFLKNNSASKSAYVRHVDDYWIGANSVEDAEDQLRRLRRALNAYELDINELKTKIVRCDAVLGQKWPVEIVREIDRVLVPYPHANTDIVSTFGGILELANSAEDEGIIRHVIKKVDERKSWDVQWKVLEHFLAQCAVQFPHSLDYVARVIAWRIRSDMDVDRPLWIDIFRRSIVRASGLGRDSEVLWSLWALKELKSRLPKILSESIIQNNNALTLAFLAHMFANGLTSDKTIGQSLWDRVEGNTFSGPYWPLSLELMHLDVANANASVVTGAEAAVRALHDKKLSLFHWSAGPAVFSKSGKSKRAIEAYTSDYDDVDDSEYVPDDIWVDDEISF